MWSHLASRVADPLVTLPEWPLAAADTAPLGWMAALDRGWQVPTYAPGLPWLMAVPHAIAGTTGAVLVVILSAGVAVWSVGALAWRLGGGLASLVAACLMASSPSFLYQAFQPMSDVPVAAAWTLCWLFVTSSAAGRAGLAASMAVLIRPNLAPLAIAPLVLLVLIGSRAGAWRSARRFGVPVAVAGAAIAILQWRWYGSPLSSGYGSAGELFAWSNVVPNTRLYGGWLWQAEAALVLAAGTGVACAAWLATRRHRTRATAAVSANRRRVPWVVAGLIAFSAGVTLAYLVYAVFEVWSYLRFLLPAIATTAAVSGIAVASALRLLPTHLRGVVALLAIACASALGLRIARQLDVFQVAAVTARAPIVGNQLARMLPPRAVLLAGEQSGSMRYLTGRPIVRWEVLDPRSLSATLAVLEARGLETWWVLDQFEEALVRTRFAGVAEAALDWPPEVEGGPLMRTRAWRIASRPEAH
jgi:4-amino-4-deoxy-L-arabinose transferase-like glycosyltransferase